MTAAGGTAAEPRAASHAEASEQETLDALFAPVRQPQPRGLGALYLTDQHRGTVETMLRAIQQGRPLVVLTGDPGIGKSTLLHGALGRLREPSTRVLRFEAPVSYDAMRQALDQRPSSGRTVLAIDGAELLSRRILRYLFLKSRALKEAGQAINVLLVGEPSLAGAVEQAVTPARPGGVPLMLALAPFTPEEAARYVEHRVMASGYPARQVMSASAVRIIAAGSAGVPAQADRLLDLSLKHASEQSQDWITGPVARAAWAESGHARRSWIGATARSVALASLVAGVAAAGYEVFGPDPQSGGETSRLLGTEAYASSISAAAREGGDRRGSEQGSGPGQSSGQAMSTDARPTRPLAITPVADMSLGTTPPRRNGPVSAGLGFMMAQAAPDAAPDSASSLQAPSSPAGSSQANSGDSQPAAADQSGSTASATQADAPKPADPGTSMTAQPTVPPLPGTAGPSPQADAGTDTPPASPATASVPDAAPAASAGTGTAAQTVPALASDEPAAPAPASGAAPEAAPATAAEGPAPSAVPAPTPAPVAPASASADGAVPADGAATPPAGSTTAAAPNPTGATSAGGGTAGAVTTSGAQDASTSDTAVASGSAGASGASSPAPAPSAAPEAGTLDAAGNTADQAPAPYAPAASAPSAVAHPTASAASPAADPNGSVPASNGPAQTATASVPGASVPTGSETGRAAPAAPTDLNAPEPALATSAPATPGSAPAPAVPASATPAPATPAPAVPASAPAAPVPEPAVTQPTPASAAATAGTRQPSAPLSEAVIATLIRRGEAMRATGDISAARLLFDRAAEAGNASAAMEAGRLRDPTYLGQLRAIGVAPDTVAAALWYRRAAALGDTRATAQLQRLEEAAR